jgi:hypothetical protein
MTTWGEVALRNNMANPDRPADPDGVTVTGVTPDAAQWLAANGVSEHEEQVAIFEWAESAQGEHPELVMLHATPNGGKLPYTRNAKGEVYSPQRVALVREGLRKGYPDISLDVARGRFHGLRIELKRADRSNKPTPEQLEWIDRLRHYGYSAVVCYGAQDAINTIKAYLAQEVGG